MKNNIIIVGASAPQSFTDELEKRGKRVIKLAFLDNAGDLVKGHADTMLCALDDETVVVSPDLKEDDINELVKAKITVIKGETFLKEQYPYDIAYNVARVGKYAFAKTEYTDPVLKNELEKRAITMINVNQGYASCSVMTVGDNAIVTADKSIAKVAETVGLDVLLISEGNIILEGAGYGFIGGTGGYTAEDEICVCGTLMNHPDGEKIIEFCKKHGKKIIETGDCDLTDIGSVF